MARRLFLLLPDVKHDRQFVLELKQPGNEQSAMHVIVREDMDHTGLPKSISLEKKKDGIYNVKQIVCDANLVLFATTLFFILFFVD